MHPAKIRKLEKKASTKTPRHVGSCEYFILMVAVDLDSNTETRLADLARAAGCSVAETIREAISEYLHDGEDARLAADRLANPGRIYTSAEIERELGL